jgi:hypothetical protein
MKISAKDGSQNTSADRLYSESAKYLVIARHSEGVKRVVTPQPHQLRTDALLGSGLDDTPARELKDSRYPQGAKVRRRFSGT